MKQHKKRGARPSDRDLRRIYDEVDQMSDDEILSEDFGDTHVNMVLVKGGHIGLFIGDPTFETVDAILRCVLHGAFLYEQGRKSKGAEKSKAA